MSEARTYYLLKRYISRELTGAERTELTLLTREEDPEVMVDILSRMTEETAVLPFTFNPADLEPLIAKVVGTDRTLDREQSPVDRRAQQVHFLKTAWFRYAAVLLLIAGTATFLYRSYQQSPKEIVNNPPLQQPDIAPGGNKAMLTLADGRTIVLDSAAIGSIASQGTTKVLKLDAGSLAYQAGNTTGEVMYNTISTPKGGQYQITLPDGSNVWLNAASSVTFPTAFGKDRTIAITGESYIEVAADKNKPFFVTLPQPQGGTTTIKVLGTSFNVNAYADEGAIKTTLVEGAVRISAYKRSQMLAPGQQARIMYADKSIQVVKAANIAQVLAWKNGLFNFEDASLKEVMQQLSRWYDIEVIYENGIPDIEFAGELSRSIKLADLLKALEVSQVHFRIEKGRRLVVLP